jgi:L-malate glycosyltransferase
VKILITNFHPRGGGGHVTYIRSLLALQDDGDVRIAVASPATSQLYESLQESGYSDLYACDFPGKPHKELPGVIRSIRRFREIVADFDPDIVHVNGGPDLSIALWSHRVGKYRIVRTHHAVRRLGKDPYHKYLYSRVSQNIFVSPQFFQSGGLYLDRRTIIPNGVDLLKFRPQPRKNMDLAARLGIPMNAFVFGSCAGVGAYKRVDLITEAAARLNSQRPFLVLALGDPEEGRRLEEKAKASGVAQFKFCGFQKDIGPFVSLFDVGFILSDSIETISFAAREMLAMGKPLISSSFSGLTENVVDEESGILTRPGNVDDVVSAMSRFLRMPPDEFARFSANARSYAVENFCINRQLREHSLVYKRVLNPE